jgi:hypothetical protein
MEEPNVGDRRVPTFIVLDEAHNFAPAEPRNVIQARVTDKLIQIAAEGRKYGLYLILATQRPRKLHPSLVLECENVCLLRVQSRVEQDFAGREFAIPQDQIVRIGGYEKGQALLAGRWVGGRHSEATIAPARTQVGGGGVPDLWLVPPDLQKRTRPASTAETDDELEDDDSTEANLSNASFKTSGAGEASSMARDGSKNTPTEGLKSPADKSS